MQASHILLLLINFVLRILILWALDPLRYFGGFHDCESVLQEWVGELNSHAVWEEIANGSLLLAPGTTTVDAEMQGLEQLVEAVASIAASGKLQFINGRVSLL